MPADIMEKIKKSFSSDSSRPELPLACPSSSRSNSVSGPEDIRTHPRSPIRGPTSPASSSDLPRCPNHDVRDAAHSPPSVLSQYLGPPVVEHKYPQDSKWRRHSVSAQEQYFTR
ncbi:hypothetical protein E4U22_008808 [Claviceps purpurea]|uniref:Uncharacterized protein n=1 Tax=Claviceps purpurea (strain 20.1) TaxID=1111077 RepID=M1WG62_CLAP2|nr:hypothetical protein E4U38_007971 [Claviceps purpurea]CCE34283.1 uncharacterized protein CPUR_08215 [Claviceps purpurea 20.1]KAG6125153.1 hypothetical protein E4U12_007537 [Claviceps purpurea]KAG6126607.1 hypothetical protein E4U28_000458 [Claviceps purpurea]KAG6148781.1 hypothetical protein E4U37_007286 [Claviceps purpurea]